MIVWTNWPQGGNLTSYPSADCRATQKSKVESKEGKKKGSYTISFPVGGKRSTAEPLVCLSTPTWRYWTIYCFSFLFCFITFSFFLSEWMLNRFILCPNFSAIFLSFRLWQSCRRATAKIISILYVFIVICYLYQNGLWSKYNHVGAVWLLLSILVFSVWK